MSSCTFLYWFHDVLRTNYKPEGSWDSAVGIVSRLEAERRQSQADSQQSQATTLHNGHTGSEVHPALTATDIEGSFPGVKQPKRETDRSLHLMPRLRRSGSILPLPLPL
jgi:hypothetical protein